MTLSIWQDIDAEIEAFDWTPLNRLVDKSGSQVQLGVGVGVKVEKQ